MGVIKLTIGFITDIDTTGGSLVVSCMWYNHDNDCNGICKFEFAKTCAANENDMRLFNELFGARVVLNYEELYAMGAPLSFDMQSLSAAAEFVYANCNDFIGVALWLEETPDKTHEVSPNIVHGLCNEAYEQHEEELQGMAQTMGCNVKPAFWGAYPWPAN